ncbi:MAG: hypothetical protein V4584_12270 [Verrucomicrobiota bacterium]
MKKLNFTLACAAISLACSQTGLSASIVGSVDPGSPASESAEIGYVTTLLGMGANQTLNSGGKQYITGSYDAPVVAVGGYLKFNSPTNPASVTGYQFVLTKYGNESWVWELGINEIFVVPQTFSDSNNSGGGLSHYSVFNSRPGTGGGGGVPDGGTTIACLGMALLGLGSMRRLVATKA